MKIAANIQILMYLIVIVFVQCKTHIKVKEVKTYPIIVRNNSGVQAKVWEHIKPYQTQLSNKLSDTLIFNAYELDKKGKNPGLGILTSEAMIMLADSLFGKKDYVVWINRGGLRTELSKGFLTVGNIFELMPFDNTLCMTEINETLYKENDDVLKNKDFIIIDRDKSSSKKLEEKMKKGCYLLVSDFLMNGGDGLKISSNNARCSNYLIRDAIIRYLKIKRKFSDTLSIKPL
jgi:hypothetical protein